MWSRFSRWLILLGLVVSLLAACGQPDQATPDPTAPAAAAYPVLGLDAYPAPVLDAYPGRAAFVDPAATPTFPPDADSGTPAAILPFNPNFYPPTPATAVPVQTPAPSGPLLRTRWPRSADQPPTTHVLLSELHIPADNGFNRTNVFSLIDLRDVTQREQVAAIATSSQTSLEGELSPDGKHIAYLDVTFHGDRTLRVIKRDGTGDTFIAEDVWSMHTYCTTSFAWSPDGTRLAYTTPSPAGQPYTDPFWVYDLRTGSAREVTRGGWMTVLGWPDAAHVLVSTILDYGQPRQIERIAVATGAREVLVVEPGPGSQSCASMARDRRELLIGGLIFDIATRQLQAGPVVFTDVAWSTDRQLLLQLPLTGEAPALVFPRDAPKQPQEVTLSRVPPYTTLDGLYLLGDSPDGRYLLISTIQTSSPQQVRERVWLLDIVADQWQLINTTGRGSVLGWVSDPTDGGP